MVPTYQERLEQLPEIRRRQALAMACRDALAVWHRQVTGPIPYVDSVVGIRHEVDLVLPDRALAEVESQLRGEPVDPAATLHDYMEPITALQDEDLELPREALFAYYAIYNLHRLQFEERGVTEILVLNQAISAVLTRQDDQDEIALRLRSWWARIPPAGPDQR